MKLSNIFWYILILGVVAIGAFVLFSASSRQDQEQVEIRNSINATQANTVKLTKQQETLKKDLNAQQARISEGQTQFTLAQTELGKAQSLLPAATESIDYGTILFNFAHTNDLDLILLTATEHDKKAVEVSKDLEDIVYHVMTIEVQLAPHELMPTKLEDLKMYIDNAIVDILKFVDTLPDSLDFTNADIEIVDMKYLEPTQDAIDSVQKPLATLKILLYSYSASKGG
jgi:hypothetical protein